MDKKTIAVCGGSFDPPTAGHSHLIEKAAAIFDIVYVVLAEHPKKKYQGMFSNEERLAMLRDMTKIIDPTGDKIRVSILPSHLYLASFAKKNNASFLIRGLRDQFDFGYEQTICRTNRRIEPTVETIYLMPDDAYSLVSSSWVKSLVGCAGWTKVIKDSVTPFVLTELKKKFLKAKFMEIMEHPLLKHCILSGREEEMWDMILNGYGNKDYHGFDHLISLFEAVNEYNLTGKEPDPVLLYSLFWHDVDPDEDKSAEMASKFFRMISHKIGGEDLKEKVTRLIRATKHTTCDYKKEDEQYIASLDLLVLARPAPEYGEYVGGVFNEYLARSGKTKEEFIPLWYKGRSDFLKGMLAREVIFPCEAFRNMPSETSSPNGPLLMKFSLEGAARLNISTELGILKAQASGVI